MTPRASGVWMSSNNAASPTPPQRIKVWDVLVRTLHWLLVAAVALSWLSTVFFGWTDVHRPAGYVALAIVLLRTVWGFTGSHYARFREFIRPLRMVRQYAHELLGRREPRYIGHNPLGGWMILALLGTVMFTCVTGWLFTTDTFWGIRWVKILHEASAWLLLGLTALHVGGVLVTSILHRENLVAAMITGRKTSPQQSDQAL